MISQDKVDQVRQLLAVGKSYREIAAAVGVSRGTVGGIATGTRVDKPRPPRQDDWREPLGPIGRCNECGGRVHLPCRLCRVRAFARSVRHRPKPRRVA